jgi:Ca2+-binding EF-hand superfamily protein|eukprot:CAMPEP_0174303508 /NCGR_PEP_ID=MMETSP0809-20121228/60220_1 /TAXON_ID=73025 ORGANISM="Eutreptiella gymnastica-like, Strain CCMP1594" /NCGR_SAMPLE_ID=MMETSP0809 /ASSEMBLY_ACC=CAM_ASM_000658 /LENGTH=934 /DNA_ID=CAMNT_0015409539 /DNA_START=80 /DNA_END=2884 /DNA_ORIENTATION=+
MADIQEILQKIRTHCKNNRVRVTEFFQDFDKLRSGLITPYQFQRCLNMLGVVNQVTQSDYEQLFLHYKSPTEHNKVNYVQFCDAVDNVFTVKNLEKSPTVRSPMQQNFLSPRKRAANPLTEEQYAKYNREMEHFVAETMARGIMLKEPFRDFDNHCNGRVTVSQFLRCFPFRVDADTTRILLQRYQDSASGDVDYLAWVRDVEDAIEAKRLPVEVKREGRRTEQKSDYGIQSLLVELQKQVLTNRIRVEEVFKDYDKLRSELVTETQFASGLGVLKFQKFSLSPSHIKMLQDHYRVQDTYGNVRTAYMRFVNDMDSVFTEKGLEKTPQRRVQPRYDLLVKEQNYMASHDEARVEAVLDHVRSMIKTRRILIKPYFKDFDRACKGVYQTKFTTRARFERALTCVGISLSPEDFKLLCDKYQAKEAGNDSDSIRYLDFCADVDPEEPEVPKTNSSSRLNAPLEPKYVPLGKTGRVTIEEVEDDIQTHCLSNRIRIHEYFRDFDTLRSGVVTKAQFATALTISGMTLRQDELDLLYVRYASPTKPGFVQWLTFADAVDEVFTCKKLEQSPTKTPGTTQRILAKKRQEQEPELSDHVEAILARLNEVVRTRGILLPPFFQDFDKHNTGRITASQFQQVLSRHHFNLSESETTALLNCYRDFRSRHINYRRFIGDVDASERPRTSPVPEFEHASLGMRPGTGPASLAASRSMTSPFSTFSTRSTGFAGSAGFVAADVPPADTDDLMNWIGVKVVKNSIRLKDFFIDTDRLRKGYVPRAKFRSALDMAGVKLDEIAFRTLEARFDNPGVPDTVNYVEFLKQVQQTEPYAMTAPPKVMPSPAMKNPVKKQYGITVFKPRPEDAILEHVQTRMATRRVNPKPYFQDFDKIRKERVTRTQFASVLDKMQLALPAEETDLLTDMFVDQRGDVDYIKFCNTVDVA